MYVDITSEPQRIISFCTGIRGLELGLELAGVKLLPVCYVEIEAVLVTNLVAQMEARLLHPCPIWTNVRTFNPRPFRDRVHGIIAGYPCTPFSLAGKRGGDKDPRHLWPYVRRAIETIRPLWIFLENVDDHLTLGFEEVSRDLRKMGYVVEAGVYSAEEVGARHERQRLFCLALANTYHRQHQRTQRQIRQGRTVADDSGKKLANSNHITGRQSNSARRNKSNETVRRGEELADSDFCRPQQWIFTRVGRSKKSIKGKKLSHTCNQGFQRERRSQSTGWNGPARLDFVVASPGEQQRPWEYPRVIKREIEPSLGLSVAGHSFREDVLRACGNMVQPEQAQLAFIELMNKHFTI